MNKTIIYILLIPMFLACNTKNDVSKWTDGQINEWFNQSEWVQLKMKPDSSINKRLFVEQNILNPASWQAALKFLKESDFNSMKPGRYELADDGTYATVNSYFTKDRDTSYFEAHRKYIDIQYVSSGEEYIGLTSLNNIIQYHKTYDADRDIEFFIKENKIQRLAQRDRFFVFFPEDGHKPCLKVKNSIMVRKIVIKIPVNTK